MNRVAEQVTAETDAKLAATNARIDQLEAVVKRNNRYDEITDDHLHNVILDRMTVGDDSVYWDFCADHHISMAQLNVLLADFERRTKRA